jgi:hypothetical protein
MSHANGLCRFSDGTIFAFIYDGTSDTVDGPLCETLEAAWERHSQGVLVPFPGGAEDEEPVVLYTDYGKGFHWNGIVSKLCMRVIDGCCPCEYDFNDGIYPEDGTPEWAEEYMKLLADQVESAVSQLGEAARAIAEILGPVIKSVVKCISELYGVTIFALPFINPKWVQYYKHSKKSRVRNKYGKMISQRILEVAHDSKKP